MKRYLKYSAIFIACVSSVSAFSSARINLEKGYVTIPDSSIANPADKGIRAHTNYQIYTPYDKKAADPMTPSGETPASLACIYGLTFPVIGCPISGTKALPTGGSGAIAIVDAYDDPNAEQELNIFSKQFGLPACTTDNGCFQKVYASGKKPKADSGWAVEMALDIEWAHAMAPNAKIILVEGDSASYSALLLAEDVAGKAVQAAGGGQVTNSWGSDEFKGEQDSDSHFQVPGVVYLASSGDSAAPASYPSSSPNVISAGGTTIVRDKNGMFKAEKAWSKDVSRGWGGGGGPSKYEARPSYQDIIADVVGKHRGTPDISFDANPSSGVAVYSSYTGWTTVGGTSVSSPALAGVLNAANTKYISSNDELNLIYSKALFYPTKDWRDIVKGNNGYPAMTGYDFATGLGSPIGYVNK